MVRLGAFLVVSAIVHAGAFAWTDATLTHPAEPRLRKGEIAVQLLPSPSAAPASQTTTIPEPTAVTTPTPNVSSAEARPDAQPVITPSAVPALKFSAQQPEFAERSVARGVPDRASNVFERPLLAQREPRDRTSQEPVAVARSNVSVVRDPTRVAHASQVPAASLKQPLPSLPPAPAATGKQEAVQSNPGSRPSAPAPAVAEGVQTPARAPANVYPTYPYEARRRGLEGRVVLAFRVTEAGDVVEPRIHASSGHALLDQAALEFVGQLRYEPARRGSQAVASDEHLAIRFRLY